MARSYPGQPANPPYPPPPAPEANPGGPPPAPSSRQLPAGYEGEPEMPLPSFENASVDMAAETVEALPDDEPNPFQKPDRLARLRQLLKKPSREFSIRAGLVAAALLVGWGAGAKPWQSEPRRAAIAAKASPGAKTAAAKAAAAKAAAAKAATAAKASKPRPAAAAESPRRVAVVAHDTQPVLIKSRAVTKTAASKLTTGSKTKSANAKTKAATKISAKKPAGKAATAKASFKAKANAKAKAKAKAKPKAVAKKAAAKQG